MASDSKPETRRLIVYGSLAPGGPNHHELAGLAGTWRKGWITGSLSWTGWGAGEGYPALRWDPEGERVPAYLLESDDLPGEWPRLDTFEGAEYRRIVIPFFAEDEERVALQGQVYSAAP